MLVPIADGLNRHIGNTCQILGLMAIEHMFGTVKIERLDIVGAVVICQLVLNQQACINMATQPLIDGPVGCFLKADFKAGGPAKAQNLICR